ncbi:DUF2933 domain-containing protein [Cupriavidus basilensis]
MHRDERYLRQESRDEMQCENDGHYRRCPGGDTGYRLRPVPAGFRALVLGAGPYLLLLLCPLSMWFMMKSMSAHDDQLSSMTEERSEQKPQPFRIKE